jgi:hypothetical protein
MVSRYIITISYNLRIIHHTGMKPMSTIDPTDFSALDAGAATDHGGWTCHLGDGLSATDFTYDNGQLVDVQHSGLGVHSDFGDLAGHSSYTDMAESYTQSFDLASHDVVGGELSAGLDYGTGEMHNAVGLENMGFESSLATHDFTPQVLPRSGADYGEASDHEGWAKHYDGMAESWAGGGYLNKAAEYQGMADAERQKMDENMNH